MTMVEESPSSSGSSGKSGLLSWRWSWSPVRPVREDEDGQAGLDSPALHRLGSPLKKKSFEAIASEEQPPETVCRVSPGAGRVEACVRNVACAGRALRNAFLSNGQENWKAHVKLARIIKRSFVGLELVQWLMEQCAGVQSRNTAAGVWNVLLEHGVLLSVERQAAFEDSAALYQFSFEECEALRCDFRNQSQWQNGVSLLLRLVPLTQLRAGTPKPCNEETAMTPDRCSRVVQMRALERLTSTVQSELVVALARKAQGRSVTEEPSPDHGAAPPAQMLCSSEKKRHILLCSGSKSSGEGFTLQKPRRCSCVYFDAGQFDPQRNSRAESCFEKRLMIQASSLPHEDRVTFLVWLEAAQSPCVHYDPRPPFPADAVTAGEPVMPELQKPRGEILL